MLRQSDLIKKTISFFLLAFFFSMLFCRISIYLTNDHRINVLAYSFGVPFAILLLKGYKYLKFENIREQKKWLLMAFTGPFIYAGILYLLGKYFFPYPPDPLNQNSTFVLGTILILFSVIFEEIGWRGYLYKFFTAEGWFKMNLSISVLWTVWHLPAIFYGGFTVPTPLPLGMTLFFVNLTLASFILGWIRQKTGGVLSPALVHAGNNIAMMLLGVSGPLLSECGIFFTIFLIGFILFTKAWKTPTLFQFSVIKEKYLS
jgi:membrane protease YdiL (CAAX protease family)